VLIVINDPAINLTLCEPLPIEAPSDTDAEVRDPTADEPDDFDYVEDNSGENDE